jgi:DNA-binding transcriptional MerR regulator
MLMVYPDMKAYSTGRVAALAGIHKQTLLRWLYAGAIPEPRRHKNGGQDIRLWTRADLENVRKYKAVHYCKGRGRKKKSKS